VKKFILFPVLILFALPLIDAVPDSVVTGPYNVSFDLGLSSNDYKINIADPKTIETLNGAKGTDYSIEIRSTTDSFHSATITIRYFEEELPIATGSDLELGLKSVDKDNPNVSDFRSDTRTIDGARGAVASMRYKYESDIFYAIYRALFDPKDTIDLYHAGYQAPFDPMHTMVEITSYFPWDNGTLNLLKTIHVTINDTSLS